jgi:hypothetical protein
MSSRVCPSKRDSYLTLGIVGSVHALAAPPPVSVVWASLGELCNTKAVAERIPVATKFKAESHASNGHGEDFLCRRERP